jgi:hypothetical protein
VDALAQIVVREVRGVVGVVEVQARGPVHEAFASLTEGPLPAGLQFCRPSTDGAAPLPSR